MDEEIGERRWAPDSTGRIDKLLMHLTLFLKKINKVYCSD